MKATKHQQQHTRYLHSKFKTAAGCTPAATTSLSGHWSKVTLQRAHPTRGQAATWRRKNGEASVHAQIKRRHVPLHTGYIHSGGATTLSFNVNGANTICSFVMRSETSGEHIVPHDNTALEHIHDNTTDHRFRKQIAKGENTFNDFLHGTIFITHWGDHNTENESYHLSHHELTQLEQHMEKRGP